VELPQTHYDVLVRLNEAREPLRIGELAAQLRLDQSPVAAACLELAERGLVQIHETPFAELSLGREGQRFAANRPLPERVVVKVLRECGGRLAANL